MVAIRHFVLLVIVLAVPLSICSRPESGVDYKAQTSLFAQSASATFNRDFASPDLSYLLLDVRSGEVLALRWDKADTPIPLGSLAKPFTALAYGEQHDFQYPLHNCRGTSTGCWRPGGHGEVDLTSAIAYSCNSYFRMLTTDMVASDVADTAGRFGLELPDRNAVGAELAGLGPRWQISPLRMARAYLELTRQRQDPAVQQILVGMARSAREGTGAEVDRALQTAQALVKTGTAACTHARHAPGDGFAVVLAPADDPKLLLMVREHGVPGSHAARIAGQMLHQIED